MDMTAMTEETPDDADRKSFNVWWLNVTSDELGTDWCWVAWQAALAAERELLTALSDLVARLRAALGSIHRRCTQADRPFDVLTAAVLVDECERAVPELRALDAARGAQP
jgi:hypothetical protein